MLSRKAAKILAASVLESLECRRLLTSITGDNSANNILVHMNGANVEYSLNGGSSWTVVGSGISSLTIDALGGNDTIQIDSLDVDSLIIKGGLGNDAIKLNDLSDVTEVLAYGYNDERPDDEAWLGDASYHIDPETMEVEIDGYDADSLFVGKDDSTGGDLRAFPTVEWDDGDSQHLDENNHVAFDDVPLDAVVINDKQDPDDRFWYVPPINAIATDNPTGDAPFNNDLHTVVSSVTGYDNNTSTPTSPGVQLRSGTGNDTIDLLGANAGYKVDGGDGNDVFNINSGLPAGSGPSDRDITQVALNGGAGDDVFNFGTGVGYADLVPSALPGTLYGISTSNTSMPTVQGDSGTDSVVVDDSNYDSTKSYAEGLSDSGAIYTITGTILRIYRDIYLQWQMTMGSDVESFELHMQSQNGTDHDVHPSVTVTNNAINGPVVLYPGSVKTDSGYEYNTINIQQSKLHPVYIKPSLGLDHVTIGDESANAAQTVFDGIPALKMRDVNPVYTIGFSYVQGPLRELASPYTVVDYLPSGTSVRLEGPTGESFFQVDGNGTMAPGNIETNFDQLSSSVAARVVFHAATAALSLPATTLSFYDDWGKVRSVYLPAVSLSIGQSAYFWIGADGTSYVGSSGQTSPDFSTIAQEAPDAITAAAVGPLTIKSNGNAVVDVGEDNDFTWTSLSVPVHSGTRGTLDVESGIVTFADAGQEVGALQFGAHGKGIVDMGLGNALKMDGLSIASGGLLDLTDSSAIIDYNSLGTLITDVRLMLQTGKLITSATTPSGTRLGYGDNADTLLHRSSFGGFTFPTTPSADFTQLLIKYTYGGDANLDGQVDMADSSIITANWTSSTAYWTKGDFDYNQSVAVGDLSIWAANMNKGVGSPL